MLWIISDQKSHAVDASKGCLTRSPQKQNRFEHLRDISTTTSADWQQLQPRGHGGRGIHYEWRSSLTARRSIVDTGTLLESLTLAGTRESLQASIGASKLASLRLTFETISLYETVKITLARKIAQSSSKQQSDFWRRLLAGSSRNLSQHTKGSFCLHGGTDSGNSSKQHSFHRFLKRLAVDTYTLVCQMRQASSPGQTPKP